ncbi:MAG: hypothetical protein ACPG49_07590 [Chitinophagales bacterium]
MEVEHLVVILGIIYFLGTWIGSGILASNKKRYLLALVFLLVLLCLTVGIPFVLFDSLQPENGWTIWSFEGWEELFYLTIFSSIGVTLMVIGIYFYSTIVFLVYLTIYLWNKYKIYGKGFRKKYCRT